MAHVNRGAILCGQKSSGKNYVANIATRELELLGKKLEVHVVCQRSLRRKHPAPELLTVDRVGQGKFHYIMHAAGKRLIQVFAQVRSQNDYAIMIVHLLQQVGDLNVGIAVMRIFHFRSLAKESIGFVKKQNSVAGLRGAEDAVQILLRFTDKFAHDSRKINLV